MRLFTIIYWLGIVAEIIIRAPYQKSRKGAATSARHISITEIILLNLLLLGMFILPLIYSVTPRLAFADYT